LGCLNRNDAPVAFQIASLAKRKGQLGIEFASAFSGIASIVKRKGQFEIEFASEF